MLYANTKKDTKKDYIEINIFNFIPFIIILFDSFSSYVPYECWKSCPGATPGHCVGEKFEKYRNRLI